MKTTILGTLIGPSSNSNQNPEAPVVAVDLQNVVAAKPKKADVDVKANETPKSAPAQKKPVDEAKPKKADATPKPNEKIIPESSIDPTSSPLPKDDREKWIKDLLRNQAMNIDEIMEHVLKVDPEWKKLSVLQYLKKPGISKDTSGKTHTYGYKA